jgi:O-antigen/teichoic acid export membrane protein
MSKTLLWQSWVYVMQAALWRVYDYIDTVMISLLGGFQQAGWYTAGKKILEGLWLVPNILTEALYPEINARVHVSKDLAASLFRRGMKYLAVAAVAAAGATVLLSGPLVEIIYGSRFAKTVDVLRVLGLAVVPSYLRYMFGNTLIAVNLQNWETVMAGVRGVVNVTANYLLIPSYGAVGAAIAFLVTDLITVVFYLWILHGANLVDRGLLLQLGKPIADALVLVPIYGLMSRLHPLVQSMALLPLYAVVLFLFRTFDKQEIDVFRKMLAEQMHKFSGHSKVANG